MAHQSILRKTSGWLGRYKAELLQYGLPFALYEVFNQLYDKVFFTFSLYQWGQFWGAIIPVLGALIINPVIYWMYDYWGARWLTDYADRSKSDSAVLKKFNEVRVALSKPRKGFWAFVRGEMVFASLLSVIDPVILAILYRESHFTGISKRDWFVLFKATIIACAIWLGILEVAFTGIKLVWHFVTWLI